MVTAAASGLAHAFAGPPLYPQNFIYESDNVMETREDDILIIY